MAAHVWRIMVSGGNEPWYHGSPYRIESIRSGSVVTPFKELAKAFAHKPSRVSMSDDCTAVTHNGELPGFLYVVSESVGTGDLVEIVGTAGTHWQIQRDMQVECLGELAVTDPPLLTEEEFEDLASRTPDGGFGFVSR